VVSRLFEDLFENWESLNDRSISSLGFRPVFAHEYRRELSRGERERERERERASVRRGGWIAHGFLDLNPNVRRLELSESVFCLVISFCICGAGSLHIWGVFVEISWRFWLVDVEVKISSSVVGWALLLLSPLFLFARWEREFHICISCL
jgi:hypothetical protein